MGLIEQIFEAGVVGAGGAGFPTHKKLAGKAHTLVVNAAECEPLLASDRYIMRTHAGEIIEALTAVRKEFGIGRVVIGTKAKYAREIAALEAAIRGQGADIEVFKTGSFYPAGDEQILIYEITGETVPPGGIPLALGIVVINVTTAYNIRRAMDGVPVTRRYVTVNGEVGTPCIVDAPVGASVADCIAAAGGAAKDRYAFVRGGPMMGQKHPMDRAESTALGKQDGGLVVLGADHPLITFEAMPVKHMINQARSVCIQCRYCTDLCPRYLIGHKLRPNRVMRSIATGTCEDDLTDAMLCCECGICELFSCPMLLSPRKMNIYIKGLLREKGVTLEDKTIYPAQTDGREYRAISQHRLIDRWALSAYPTDIETVAVCSPQSVHIPLKHGVGRPSEPTVQPGDRVQPGDTVAAVAFEDVGCMVHASIAGTVTAVDSSGITIAQEGGAAL